MLLPPPMRRRAGVRGAAGPDDFERISWDEALDTIAAELGRVIEKYGNEAVFRIYGTGKLGGVVSSRDGVIQAAWIAPVRPWRLVPIVVAILKLGIDNRIS